MERRRPLKRPLVLDGLVAELGGPHTPVVWVPVVDIAGEHDHVGRAGAVYGRIVSPVGWSSVAGTPGVDEVVEPRPLIIEELT